MKFHIKINIPNQEHIPIEILSLILEYLETQNIPWIENKIETEPNQHNTLHASILTEEVGF